MAHSKLYQRIMNSREWVALRDRKRVENPYCEACMARGIVEPMHAVHHIREIEGARTVGEAWERALAWNNLQSLCAECHKQVHTGSHTKQAHKQRSNERLEQFANSVTGNLPPGGMFLDGGA